MLAPHHDVSRQPEHHADNHLIYRTAASEDVCYYRTPLASLRTIKKQRNELLCFRSDDPASTEPSEVTILRYKCNSAAGQFVSYKNLTTLLVIEKQK
jgi:hypothetical protein